MTWQRVAAEILRVTLGAENGYLVKGYYCPTNRNPETEADKNVTQETVGTEAEADNLLLWYPGGTKRKIEEAGP